MEKETMDTISFYASIALAFTAVVTMIFLLWQTIILNNQTKIANKSAELSNRIAKVEAYQTRYQLFAEMDKLVIEYPTLKKFISNEQFNLDYDNKVIDDGKAKEIAFIEMVMNICQLSYYQYKEELNNKEMEWIKELIHNKSIKSYWRGNYRCKYRSDFESFINEEMGYAADA